MAPSPTVFAHEALAVVVQVRDGQLCVLLWRRGQAPQRHRWALPGGRLAAGEDLESSIARHLATKVDVTELRHLEQLTTLSAPRRHPGERLVATTFLGLVPSDAEPSLPADTVWHPTDDLPPTAFDHGDAIRAGVERLRAKLSYTNIGFALAPRLFTISELRRLYRAALGHDVSATNLQRVLVRRHLLEATGSRRDSGPSGGRPAELYCFRARTLEITDQFAVLRPPTT